MIPIEASFFATADPATLLFTGAMADDILEKATPSFIENEFLQDDVNKFAWLVRSGHSQSAVWFRRRIINWSRAGDTERFLSPLGLGDELAGGARHADGLLGLSLPAS